MTDAQDNFEQNQKHYNNFEEHEAPIAEFALAESLGELQFYP